MMLTAATSAGADVIATEDFESYTQQTLSSTSQFGTDAPDDTPNGGSGWSAAWSVDDGQNDGVDPTLGVFIMGNGLDYSAGSVSVDGGDNQFQMRRTSSIAQGVASRQIPDQTGTVYLRFLIRGSDTDGEGNGLADDFVQIGFSTSDIAGSGDAGGAFVGSALVPYSDGTIRARVGGDSDGNSASSVAYADDTTWLVVLKLEKDGSSNYNKATVFLDPTSTTESGGLVATLATSQDTVSYVSIRAIVGDSWDQLNVDEIVVASTFAEAINPVPVPEPATFALLAAGGAGLLVRRRRR